MEFHNIDLGGKSNHIIKADFACLHKTLYTPQSPQTFRYILHQKNCWGGAFCAKLRFTNTYKETYEIQALFRPNKNRILFWSVFLFFMRKATIFYIFLGEFKVTL